LFLAIHVGMQVGALGTTAVVEAVPGDAGVVSTRVDVLAEAARRFLCDPEAARDAGLAARAHALEHFGLERFLTDWDDLLEEVVTDARGARVRTR
jgi:glycosyltransferase involved in cell wall biosynthesis